jgi:DNA-binding response OmpR family regulator
MSKTNKVYIVDDKSELFIDGFETTVIKSPSNIDKILSNQKAALILIQGELNDMDGIEVVKQIKNNGIATPIVLVSSKDSSEDIIQGFDIGCDDYITKPYAQAILNAKINSIISRTQKHSNDFQLGNIFYNGKSNSFTIDNEKIHLTKLEKKLLLEFMKNNNKILTRNHLLDNVWNDVKVKEATISVVIKRLKEKIDPTNEKDMIRSIYGKGYLFVA